MIIVCSTIILNRHAEAVWEVAPSTDAQSVSLDYLMRYSLQPVSTLMPERLHMRE